MITIFNTSGRIIFESDTAEDMREAVKEAIQKNVDLPYADFKNQDLTEAHFENAYLPYADFSNAECYCANFRNAWLGGSNFDRANCIDVDFSGANLNSSKFRYSGLNRTSFKNASMRYTDLCHADLRLANLIDARLGGSSLLGSHLRDTKGLVELPTGDPRGYRLIAIYKTGGEWLFYAGCRGPWTVKECRKHWNEDYCGDPLIAEKYARALDWWESSESDDYRLAAMSD